MLFKKRTNQNNEHALKDKVAKGIAGFLLAIQSRFADFMTAKTKMLSTKAKWFWLSVFCIAFGSCSIYAFIEAIGSNQKGIRPSHSSIPKLHDRAEPEIKQQPVSEKDMKRIIHFKKYMDSLRQSSEGKIIYDSILKRRPGLMDSIHAIEQIYYSQSK